VFRSHDAECLPACLGHVGVQWPQQVVFLQEGYANYRITGLPETPIFSSQIY
jgi:hypothetical protein